MGVEVMEAEVEVMMSETSRTWVCVGVKGNHPILTISKIVSDSSVDTIPTAEEVYQVDWRGRVKTWGIREYAE